MFEEHLSTRPASRALPSAGRSRAIKIAMMAMTTRSSMSVKACLPWRMSVTPNRELRSGIGCTHVEHLRKDHPRGDRGVIGEKEWSWMVLEVPEGILSQRERFR